MSVRIEQGRALVDDASKRTRNVGDGDAPTGGPLPDAAGELPRDPDALYRLLEARLGLGDLRRIPLGDTGAVRQMPEATRPTGGTGELQEMTPTPMVVAAQVEFMASGATKAPAVMRSRSLVNVDADADADKSRVDNRQRDEVVGRFREHSLSNTSDEAQSAADYPDELAVSQSSYHPPRIPPSSLVPPPAAASFSIASEYDPRAPTKPKVRRNTSAPPPPLLFGLDRMLVWGLVLGGVFVAAIVVIVHQLALTTSVHSSRSNAGHLDGTAIGAQQSDRQMPMATTEQENTIQWDDPAPVSSLAPPDSTTGAERSGATEHSNDRAASPAAPPLASTGRTDSVPQRTLGKPISGVRSKAKPSPSAANDSATPKGTQPWLE